MPSDSSRGVTLALHGLRPEVHVSAWLAPGSVVAGAVVVEAMASLWYGVVVRAEATTIRIGVGTNLQDGVVVHGDAGFPVDLGSGVTVGHGAVLHGCVVGDDSLVGLGARILNGAWLGPGCIVAAGAVVPQDVHVPPGSLVSGVPAKVRRSVTEEERSFVRANAAEYRRLADDHQEAWASAIRA